MHSFAYSRIGRLSQFTCSLKRLDQSIPSYFPLLVYAVFVVTVLVVVRAFQPDGIDRDTDFGFLSYSKSLVTTGEWKSCTTEYCNYASRMPLLALLHTAIFLFPISPSKFAYLQTFVLGLVTSALYIYLFRLYIQCGWGTKTIWFFLGAVITLLGIAAKHAAVIKSEEGVIIWLMVPLSLAIALLPSKAAAKDHNLGTLCIITSILVIILYFAKSSMILISLICILYVLSLGVRHRSKIAVLSALIALTMPITWGIFVDAHTNRFSLMTSWDGENLYRGWNAESIDLYPAVSLDREFDASKIVLPNGREIIVAPKPPRENFGNEWEWNDYYKNLTYDFIYKNPAASLKFLSRKAYIYFVYIFQTPTQYPPSPARHEASPIGAGNHEALKEISIPLWRLAGRIIQACLLALCIFVWIRLKALRTEAALLLSLNIAYAVPYVVGFSYDRHVTVSIVLAAGGLMALGPLTLRALLEPNVYRGPRK